MRCHCCSEEITTSYLKSEDICQACHLYRSKGHKYYTPSRYGRLELNEHGYPICHICGQAHTSLGNHVSHKHGLSPAEYKERFGLNQRCSLASEKLRLQMRTYNSIHADTVVKRNLLIHGAATRFQPNVVRTNKHKRKSKYTVVSFACADTERGEQQHES